MSRAILNSDFGKVLHKIKADIEGYKIEIGVLDDVTTGEAIDGSLKPFHGKLARKASYVKRDKSNQEIAETLRSQYDFLQEPFENDNNKEVQQMLNELVKQIMTKTNIKRVENTAQAIVRNPILRGDYGRNSDTTASIKGFSEPLIDTGSLFNSIKARVVAGA